MRLIVSPILRAVVSSEKSRPVAPVTIAEGILGSVVVLSKAECNHAQGKKGHIIMCREVNEEINIGLSLQRRYDVRTAFAKPSV